MVTRDSFTEYYANVAAAVDGDDYFELMLRNAWHLAGDVPYTTAADGDDDVGDVHGRPVPAARAAQRPARPATAVVQAPARRLHAAPPGALPQPLTRFAPVNMAEGGDEYDGTVVHPLVDALRERLVAAGVRGFVGLQVRPTYTLIDP